MDLKFPHHECEIAQCKSANKKEPVNYWMHTNMLTLNGARMSKSTGNTLLPQELFSGNNDKMEKPFDPIVVRFFMMQAHYRSELDFSSEALEAAEKGYLRLMGAMAALGNIQPKEITEGFELKNWQEACYSAMNDDFNSPMLIAHLFDAVRFINALNDGKASISKSDLNELSKSMNAFVYDVLGMRSVEKKQQNTDLVDGLMRTIVDLRLEARNRKDFTTADQIRDHLKRLNIELKDSKDGTRWEIE